MKKLFIFAICVLTLSACGDGIDKRKLAELNQRIDSLTVANVQKDNEINDLMDTYNLIEEGFQAINEAQERVTVERSGEGANAVSRIKENMAFIQETLNQNKELINSLQKKVRDGSITNERLKKSIESMTEQLTKKEQEIKALMAELDQKDIHIAELDEQVANLNDNVTQLTNDNAQKDATINQQTQDLNTAWYAFGTKKELKDQGILQSGEVLKGNFNKEYFTKIDIRVDKEIKLMSRDARLLTNHPEGSYTLQRDANKLYVLRITNPEQFWATSKYLVIQVK
jgi:chromosome segregation ATPase